MGFIRELSFCEIFKILFNWNIWLIFIVIWGYEYLGIYMSLCFIYNYMACDIGKDVFKFNFK